MSKNNCNKKQNQQEEGINLNLGTISSPSTSFSLQGACFSPDSKWLFAFTSIGAKNFCKHLFVFDATKPRFPLKQQLFHEDFGFPSVSEKIIAFSKPTTNKNKKTSSSSPSSSSSSLGGGGYQIAFPSMRDYTAFDIFVLEPDLDGEQEKEEKKEESPPPAQKKSKVLVVHSGQQATSITSAASSSSSSTTSSSSSDADSKQTATSKHPLNIYSPTSLNPDVPRWRIKGSCSAHSNHITSLAFHPRSSHVLISCSADCTVEIAEITDKPVKGSKNKHEVLIVTQRYIELDGYGLSLNFAAGGLHFLINTNKSFKLFFCGRKKKKKKKTEEMIEGGGGSGSEMQRKAGSYEEEEEERRRKVEEEEEEEEDQDEGEKSVEEAIGEEREVSRVLKERFEEERLVLWCVFNHSLRGIVSSLADRFWSLQVINLLNAETELVINLHHQKSEDDNDAEQEGENNNNHNNNNNHQQKQQLLQTQSALRQEEDEQVTDSLFVSKVMKKISTLRITNDDKFLITVINGNVPNFSQGVISDIAVFSLESVGDPSSSHDDDNKENEKKKKKKLKIISSRLHVFSCDFQVVNIAISPRDDKLTVNTSNNTGGENLIVVWQLPFRRLKFDSRKVLFLIMMKGSSQEQKEEKEEGDHTLLKTLLFENYAVLRLVARFLPWIKKFSSW